MILAPVAVTPSVVVEPAQITAVVAGCSVITAAAYNDTNAVPDVIPVPYVSVTLAIVYVVAVAGVTAIVPVVVPAANVLTVPSFNVTVVVPVPVKPTVNVAVDLSQIVVDPLNTAVGLANTVINALAVVKLVVLELFVDSFITLTNV